MYRFTKKASASAGGTSSETPIGTSPLDLTGSHWTRCPLPYGANHKFVTARTLGSDMYMGRIHSRVGLGLVHDSKMSDGLDPVVKFFLKMSVIFLSLTPDHDCHQSGSSRASLMGMRDGMKTHWCLKKA